MSSSLNIYPFENIEGVLRFGAQTLIFVVGLFVSNFFVLRPAFKLYLERKKRTTDNINIAKSVQEKADQLKKEYSDKTNKLFQIIREEQKKLILDHQKNSLKQINEYQKKAENYLLSVKEKISEEVKNAKLKQDKPIQEIVKLVSEKLGLLISVFFIFLLLSVQTRTYASEKSLLPNIMQGVFWPYFQFFVFVITLFYIANKPLRNFLEKKRDDFRSKLTEAQEALLVSNRVMDELNNKLKNIDFEISKVRETQLAITQMECEKIIFEAEKTAKSILEESKRAALDLIIRSQQEFKKEIVEKAFDQIYKELNSKNLSHLDKKLQNEIFESLKIIGI